jgi:putative transposase
LTHSKDWVDVANEVQTAGEVEAVRRSLKRGCPLGDKEWQRKTAGQLGLEFTLRPRGRPGKKG